MTYTGWAVAILAVGVLMLVHWAHMLFTDMGAGVSMRRLARIGFVNLYSLMLPALGLALALTGAATLLQAHALVSAVLMTLGLIAFLAVVLSLFPVNLPQGMYPERRAATRSPSSASDRKTPAATRTTPTRTTPARNTPARPRTTTRPPTRPRTPKK